MDAIASIGELVFRLESVDYRCMERPDGGGVALLDGETIRLVDDQGRRCLLIDHRLARSEDACRVEYWRCLFSGESRVDGLLVLGDARVRPASERARATNERTGIQAPAAGLR